MQTKQKDMFLEVTNTIGEKNLVNVSEVSTIAPFEKGAVINLNSGKFLQVTESYEQVKTMIKSHNLISLEDILEKPKGLSAKSLNF